MFLRLVLCFGVALMLVGAAAADVPQLINYQGILLDTAGDPVTTPTTVLFAVWNADFDGDSLWSEEQSVSPDDDGRFAVLLGSVSPIPDSAFAGAETYLSVKVDTDPEMTPRQRFASVAYAYRDNDWALVEDVLLTQGEWGLARAGNVLYGDHDSTHVNLGVACTTGTTAFDAMYATVGGGVENTAGAWAATVSGGCWNTASQGSGTVSGGHTNKAEGGSSAIGGGETNQASGDIATIGGGAENTASNWCATVGGGAANTASGEYSTVPGGHLNLAQGHYSFAAGRRAKANHLGTFVWGGGTDADFSSTAANQYLIRASSGVGINANDPTQALDVNGQVRIRGGGAAAGKVLTSASDGTATWETPTGGADNDWALIGDVLFTSGEWGIARAGNTLYGDYDSTHVNLGVACTTGTSGQNDKYSTVGGGYQNTASDWLATVGGGYKNNAYGYTATVAGGYMNTASNSTATVGGGIYNNASGPWATVGGGYRNTASGQRATVPGGMDNTAYGTYSFAAGLHAKANHNGAFVWGDGTDADFTSSAANQFRARASGGVWFYTNSTLTSGVTVPAGGGAWAAVSDREMKRNIRPVDGAELLEKLAQLEVSRWSYNTQDEGIEHIGPMAQDLYRLFGVGDNDKTISTIDPDGIALAAIQQLHQQNQEQQKEIAELKALVRQLLADKK